VDFRSQSSSIASIDHDGEVDAIAAGQTFLGVNWDAGALEDTLPIEVLPTQ